jgi:hypothetical protein
MIRVFVDGWTVYDRIDAGEHGGTLFVVRNEADLERLFRVHPSARGARDRLRAILDLKEEDGK